VNDKIPIVLIFLLTGLFVIRQSFGWSQ